tara:strand:- start:748 stop:2343 length:1596 start_codon:yes stop_codon:yes gene_type:complete
MKKTFLFLFISIFCFADDLIVDGSGLIPNSYSTITEALSAANEGDNILVSVTSTGGYRNENLVIDKSVSIFTLQENEYFSMQGNIMINLDDVLEFSIIGGIIDGKIEANLINQSRENNTTVNLIDCLLLQNVYLNYITCVTNIFKCVRYGNVDFQNNADAFQVAGLDISFNTVQYYNANYLNCYDFGSSVGNGNTINWSDIYKLQPENCDQNTSILVDAIPSISINCGNVIASEFYKLIIGHGDDVWQNSPIENDTMVNIIANKFGVLLFDNPSFGFNIKNNKIDGYHYSNNFDIFAGNISSGATIDYYTIIEELNPDLDIYHGWSLNTQDYNKNKSYSHIFIFSANSDLNSTIHNNETECSPYGAFLGIDNESFNQNNLTIFNNNLLQIGPAYMTYISNWSFYPNSAMNPPSPGGNVKGTYCLIRNFNPDYSGKLWYNAVNNESNYSNSYQLGFDIDYKSTTSQNTGHPYYEFYDLDLTRNDVGIDGGSTPWSMFHTNSIGKGRIFWLNLPSVLNNTANFQIKAKGAHLK